MEFNYHNCGVGDALLQPMVVEARAAWRIAAIQVAELGPDAVTSKLDLRIPRDREGTFDPKLIARCCSLKIGRAHV